MIPLQTAIYHPSHDPGNPVIASSKNKTNSLIFINFLKITFARLGQIKLGFIRISAGSISQFILNLK